MNTNDLLTPAAFLALPTASQHAHLRALALEAGRTDTTRGHVQQMLDALRELCAALPDETPTPDCRVLRIGELIGDAAGGAGPSETLSPR